MGSHPASPRLTRVPLLGAGEGVGVFVGISTPDYADLAKAASEISAYSATGARGCGARLAAAAIGRQAGIALRPSARCMGLHGGAE